MMLEHEYETMRRVEDTYWWYAVLRSAVADEVASQFAKGAHIAVLDAGCGAGGMLAALRERNPEWQLSGADLSSHAVEFTRHRGFEEVHCGCLSALPFADASFDAVLCLDVLYCGGVDNEHLVLSEIARVLKPGGMFVLNLPAFELLRGRHDTAVNGVRRYTQSTVRKLLSAHAFEVERVHCWNAWLFLPILAWRLLSRRLHPTDRTETKSDLVPLPTFLNNVFKVITSVDMKVCRALNFPLGSSVYAVAIKRSAE